MSPERSSSQTERLEVAKAAVEERMSLIKDNPRISKARDLKTINVSEGTFEAALLNVRDALPEQFHDDDFSWWEGFEKKANTSPSDAVFQYYLKGVKHEELANSLLQSIPRVKRAILFEDLSPEDYRIYHGRLAAHLLQFYPKKYQRKHGLGV